MSNNLLKTLEEKILLLIDQNEFLKLEKEDLEEQCSNLQHKNQIMRQKLQQIIADLQNMEDLT